jgi:hypothetical protein
MIIYKMVKVKFVINNILKIEKLILEKVIVDKL